MTIEHLLETKEHIEAQIYMNASGQLYRLKQFETPEKCREVKDNLVEQLNEDFAGQDVVYLVFDDGATRYAEYVKNRISTFTYEERHLKVSSYGNGTETSGHVKYDKGQLLSYIQPNKPLLIMEDIIDTGTTLQEITDFIANLPQEQQPERLIICTLFDKPARRRPEVSIQPHYVGMKLNDVFFVGEGPDYQQQHREINGLYEVIFLPDEPTSSEWSQAA